MGIALTREKNKGPKTEKLTENSGFLDNKVEYFVNNSWVIESYMLKFL
jgi:hypothetical protein